MTQGERGCLFCPALKVRTEIQSELIPSSRVTDLVEISVSELVLSTAVGHIRSTEVLLAVESAGLRHGK